MSHEKSWQKEPLRFPRKAIIVMDDRAGRAARCARKIIETFSCQAARATNEGEFIQILQKATREKCEIAAIITDDSMHGIKGSEILDGFARVTMPHIISNPQTRTLQQLLVCSLPVIII